MSKSHNVVLNQNKQIRLYLHLLAVVGALFFFGFLVTNFLIIQKNSVYLEKMRTRDFPLIEHLLILKEDLAELRQLYENVVLFESEFLLHEAQEKVLDINRVLAIIEALRNSKDSTLTIRKALTDYSEQSESLVKALISEKSDVTAFNDRAQEVTKAFKILEGLVVKELASQQDSYALYLELINYKLSGTNMFAAIVGAIMLIAMGLMTVFISRRIMQALQRADNLKENFLTTVGHELRTPLNGIQGALDLMASKSSVHDNESLIQVAKFSTRRIGKTVDDIILYSELQSTDLQVSSGVCQLSQITKVINNYAQDYCAEKGLCFKLTVDVPMQSLECDLDKINSIVIQLIDNAVKYTVFGSVCVHIKGLTPCPQLQSDTLKITITDDGVGLKNSDQDNLFVAFEQEQTGWNRAFQGLGLGLCMSKIYVDALGGFISLTNRDDAKGAVAKVNIPCRWVSAVVSDSVETDAELAEKDSQTVEKTSEKKAVVTKQPVLVEQNETIYSPPSALPKVMALIVEDDKSNQMILGSHLKALGIGYEIANNGQEAVEAFKRSEFALIFMDCQMPVMDGFEATKVIRELAEQYHRQSVPIVAITANTREVDRTRCFEVGMNDFLGKPVRKSALQEVIEHYLRAG